MDKERFELRARKWIAEELFEFAGRYGAHQATLWEGAGDKTKEEYLREADFFIAEVLPSLGYTRQPNSKKTPNWCNSNYCNHPINSNLDIVEPDQCCECDNRQPEPEISPYEIPHAAYDKYFTPPEPPPDMIEVVADRERIKDRLAGLIDPDWHGEYPTKVDIIMDIIKEEGYKSPEDVWDLTMVAKKSGWNDCETWYKAKGCVQLEVER